ncbi:MAG TPA: hypothetical protein VFM21_09445 [Terriglobia bacterium]|nr:hypothetical protein [Terriglobia bacterium]
MNTLVPFIWIAGFVHLLLLAANGIVPKKLAYRENLARLSPIVRQVFILHSVFTAFTLLAFGGVCFFFATELAAGGTLARSVSGFIAGYWLLRFLLQLFYVDRETRRAHRVGDFAYSFAIFCLGAVFAAAALGAGR